MIYSDGTFVPNTFAGSPIGEVAREARLALNFGVRVEITKKPRSIGPGLEASARGTSAYFRIISFTDLPAGIIGSTCSV